jgi:hypothetical protein
MALFEPPPGFKRTVSFPGDYAPPWEQRMRLRREWIEDWFSGLFTQVGRMCAAWLLFGVTFRLHFSAYFSTTAMIDTCSTIGAWPEALRLRSTGGKGAMVVRAGGAALKYFA